MASVCDADARYNKDGTVADGAQGRRSRLGIRNNVRIRGVLPEARHIHCGVSTTRLLERRARACGPRSYPRKRRRDHDGECR